jgi:hypothetical protein
MNSAVHHPAATPQHYVTRPRGITDDRRSARPTGGHYLCQGIIRRRDGDLYAQTGPIDETQPVGIVGGTRAYNGARGEFTQVELPDETGTWTIKLRR